MTKNTARPFLEMGSAVQDSRFWRWGVDNLFPDALALISRKSTTHRRIINDKADYISGKGFTFDESLPGLGDFVSAVNGCGESLRSVLNKLAFDKSLFGNAFVEIVTDQERSFLSLFHQDASKCRVARDSKHVILHHNWHNFTPSDAKTLSIYPNFEQDDEGFLRSIIHYKDYEPGFEHYGIPPYVAGLDVSAISYKTDEWNISRLDNSFQLSGVMILDSNLEDQAQAQELVRTAQKRFAGKPGQVMFMVQQGEEYEKSRFIPISSSNEGDWKDLHDQATTDIVVAHSWFRSLSGIDYSSGFSSERILHEYEIALNTVILPEQEEILEPLREVISLVLGLDAQSLSVINKPPTRSMPDYMRVWEARKADGLDYDPEDESQCMFLSQI
ncbi:MAG: phage portal protein [Rikenellaceae bacterium]